MKQFIQHYTLLIAAFAILLAVPGCKQNDERFEGQSVTYTLFQGPDYDIYGTVTFTEQADQSTLVAVVLENTEPGLVHPVHLHDGPITEPDADIALLMEPLAGQSGKSTTVVKMLDNGRVVTYDDLVAMNASVKVHLASAGPEQDIILAGGNVGAAFDKDDLANGRFKIAVCKSN